MDGDWAHRRRLGPSLFNRCWETGKAAATTSTGMMARMQDSFSGIKKTNRMPVPRSYFSQQDAAFVREWVVEPCENCPQDTYRSRTGGTERGSCTPCPARSTTLGMSGMTSIFDCVCDSQFYLVNLSSTVFECQVCPMLTSSAPGRGPRHWSLLPRPTPPVPPGPLRISVPDGGLTVTGAPGCRRCRSTVPSLICSMCLMCEAASFVSPYTTTVECRVTRNGQL